MTILIDNFSIGVGEWIEITPSFCFTVDVVDDTYSIVTSGTYFIHDGQDVSTTHSGITNGYKCYYCPVSLTSSGTIDLIIHAENTSSEVVEQTFHLLYGYHCAFDEIADWGPKKEVITTIESTNLVICPNTEGETFYFETKDLESYNLGATIVSVESVNLGATIYPQNTFFFYGRTYTVTVSGVKDFAGNEMAPYVFSFTIEDPTL